MSEEHPEQGAQAPRDASVHAPRNVHWGAVAGAVVLGLGALLRKRRQSRAEKAVGRGLGAK